jgi:hypothetical protein
MNSAAGDGYTIRTHLQRAAELTGQVPEKLRGPELPDGAVYLWAWFSELDAGRAIVYGVGPQALSYAEISAWAALHRLRLMPFELECLRELDQAYLRRFVEEARKRRKK